MRFRHGLWGAAVAAGLLTGSCVTEPIEKGAVAARPTGPHARAPLSFSARVVGSRRPDFYSFDTIVESPPFKGKQGEELALAFYKYFTSTNDGSYHFWSIDESEGRPQVRGHLDDPIKMLNAYGWMICGQHSQFLYSLYRAAGLPARQFGAPGHCLCEVNYDSRWHVFDVDMWTWFRTPDGHIASAYELSQHAFDLIVTNQSKSHPCNLPDRDLPGYADMYAHLATRGDRPADVWPPWETRAHTMDFALRPGETLIRSQRSEGRFPFPASWLGAVREHNPEWKGEPRERYAPFRTYGNGRWIYEPNLTAGFVDFPAGVRERQGIVQTPDGLAGEGQCVVPFVSPYPFVSCPDFSGDHVVYRDGSWLTLSASGDVKIEVSDPLGNWQRVPLKATGKPERVDLSPLVEARYAFNVRMTLGSKARVSRFRFEGWVLTAPMSLPRLDEGINVMTLRRLDKYGLATVPCEILPDFRTCAAVPLDRQAAIRNGELRPGIEKWQVIAPKGQGPVQATFTFAAPAGERFAWFYALGTVAEGPTNAPKQRARLEWSCDGSGFAPLSEAVIDNTPLQWDCSIDGEKILEKAGRTVQVRMISDTPIGGLQFVGHLDLGAALSVRPEIVHRWMEGGKERSFIAPPATDRYYVRCGPNPGGHVIEMSVPSFRAALP